jgi:hypothetical protein
MEIEYEAAMKMRDERGSSNFLTELIEILILYWTAYSARIMRCSAGRCMLGSKPAPD